MTDADVIAAIWRTHLKANICNPCYVQHFWAEAWVDPGETMFGAGPYVKLPVAWQWREGSDETERVVIRVYAPARLRRRLQREWVQD